MPEQWESHLVPMADGRTVETVSYGRGTSGTLVFHNGTPGGPVPRDYLAAACDAFDLRLVMTARPGYAQSSPRPGRVAADIPGEIAHVLDHLGVDTFVSMGCSGGGMHVLACAALLPGRCTAAAAVVSPAPIDAKDLDYYAGMAAENVEEWQLAEQGRDVVQPWLERTAASISEQGIDAFTGTFGDGFPAVDLALFESGFGETMGANLEKALSTGVEGWLEDDIALVTPWGFDLGAITTPVSVWAGKQDRMVSWEHSVWLARNIPGADLHVLADHGHLSVQVDAVNEMVEDLVRKSAC